VSSSNDPLVRAKLAGISPRSLWQLRFQEPIFGNIANQLGISVQLERLLKTAIRPTTIGIKKVLWIRRTAEDNDRNVQVVGVAFDFSECRSAVYRHLVVEHYQIRRHPWILVGPSQESNHVDGFMQDGCISFNDLAFAPGEAKQLGLTRVIVHDQDVELALTIGFWQVFLGKKRLTIGFDGICLVFL